MKLGAALRGYEIITKPTNAGAGKCVWAFATKGGEEYFIKKFLDPKHPSPTSMGTPEHKKLLLAQCDEFERRHRSVIDLIDPSGADAGNLVTARDFFLEGTTYYKVTERLHPAELDAPHELTTREKRVLLGTLAASLQLLHGLGIVHGDLKPDNILLHQPSSRGLYTAKLIDFDDAYVSGDPLDRNLIGGDPVHGAPEWVRYVQDETVSPEQLTTAVDVFALALVVHVYLTGALPICDPRFASVAEAVNAGSPPVLDERLHPSTAEVLRKALSVDPAARPDVARIREVLKDEAALELVAPKRVRINLTGSTDPKPPLPPSAPDGRSRLRINLNGRSR
jgi:serine/threonine protein kinase